MAEAKRVPEGRPESNLGLDGFEQFFTVNTEETGVSGVSGDPLCL